MILSHALRSRRYVSGLLIDTWVVASLGFRARRGLISGQVNYDHLGCQTLGANFPFHAIALSRTLVDRDGVRRPS